MALCEMILASQLLAGNWSDLHANGVRLLKVAAGSGEIKISFLAPFDSRACEGETKRARSLCAGFHLPFAERDKRRVCLRRIA